MKEKKEKCKAIKRRNQKSDDGSKLEWRMSTENMI
jgi:hypothetical protein